MKTPWRVNKILLNRINRLVSVYRDVGLAGIAKRLIRKLIPQGDSSHARWVREKEATDAAFDTSHGVQTGGVQEIFGLDIVGENACHGIAHIATDPGQFKSMVDRLKVDFSEFTFIDLGSGKGRAVILAASHPFRRVIGVEFAAELHEAAKRNIASMPYSSAEIQLVHGDAAAYDFPDGPLIVYLFNPFGSIVVRRIVNALLASWHANPRPIRVVYANPVHLGDFVSSGWSVIDATADPVILAPTGRN